MNKKLEQLIHQVTLEFHRDVYGKNTDSMVFNQERFEAWYQNKGRNFIITKLDFLDLRVINDLKVDFTEVKHDEKTIVGIIEKAYDKDGNASHYNRARLNSIIKYERTYGTLGVMVFCEINADKYKDRIGKKEGQSVDQELLKANWYENAAHFFFQKLGTKEEIIINNYRKEQLPWLNK
jgi:hypothetical protein